MDNFGENLDHLRQTEPTLGNMSSDDRLPNLDQPIADFVDKQNYIYSSEEPESSLVQLDPTAVEVIANDFGVVNGHSPDPGLKGSSDLFDSGLPVESALTNPFVESSNPFASSFETPVCDKYAEKDVGYCATGEVPARDEIGETCDNYAVEQMGNVDLSQGEGPKKTGSNPFATDAAEWNDKNGNEPVGFGDTPKNGFEDLITRKASDVGLVQPAKQIEEFVLPKPSPHILSFSDLQQRYEDRHEGSFQPISTKDSAFDDKLQEFSESFQRHVEITGHMAIDDPVLPEETVPRFVETSSTDFRLYADNDADFHHDSKFDKNRVETMKHAAVEEPIVEQETVSRFAEFHFPDSRVPAESDAHFNRLTELEKNHIETMGHTAINEPVLPEETVIRFVETSSSDFRISAEEDADFHHDSEFKQNDVTTGHAAVEEPVVEEETVPRSAESLCPDPKKPAESDIDFHRDSEFKQGDVETTGHAVVEEPVAEEETVPRSAESLYPDSENPTESDIDFHRDSEFERNRIEVTGHEAVEEPVITEETVPVLAQSRSSDLKILAENNADSLHDSEFERDETEIESREVPAEVEFHHDAEFGGVANEMVENVEKSIENEIDPEDFADKPKMLEEEDRLVLVQRPDDVEKELGRSSRAETADAAEINFVATMQERDDLNLTEQVPLEQNPLQNYCKGEEIVQPERIDEENTGLDEILKPEQSDRHSLSRSKNKELGVIATIRKVDEKSVPESDQSYIHALPETKVADSNDLTSDLNLDENAIPKSGESDTYSLRESKVADSTDFISELKAEEITIQEVARKSDDDHPEIDPTETGILEKQLASSVDSDNRLLEDLCVEEDQIIRKGVQELSESPNSGNAQIPCSERDTGENSSPKISIAKHESDLSQLSDIITETKSVGSDSEHDVDMNNISESEIEPEISDKSIQLLNEVSGGTSENNEDGGEVNVFSVESQSVIEGLEELADSKSSRLTPSDVDVQPAVVKPDLLKDVASEVAENIVELYPAHLEETSISDIVDCFNNGLEPFVDTNELVVKEGLVKPSENPREPNDLSLEPTFETLAREQRIREEAAKDQPIADEHLEEQPIREDLAANQPVDEPAVEEAFTVVCSDAVWREPELDATTLSAGDHSIIDDSTLLADRSGDAEMHNDNLGGDPAEQKICEDLEKLGITSQDTFQEEGQREVEETTNAVSELPVEQPCPSAPSLDSIAQPESELVHTEPIAEAVSIPTVLLSPSEPELISVSEPIVEPVSAPTVDEQVPQPDLEPVSEPTVDEPVSQPEFEPVSEPMVDEHLSHPATEPAVELISDAVMAPPAPSVESVSGDVEAVSEEVLKPVTPISESVEPTEVSEVIQAVTEQPFEASPLELNTVDLSQAVGLNQSEAPSAAQSEAQTPTVEAVEAKASVSSPISESGATIGSEVIERVQPVAKVAPTQKGKAAIAQKGKTAAPLKKEAPKPSRPTNLAIKETKKPTVKSVAQSKSVEKKPAPITKPVSAVSPTTKSTTKPPPIKKPTAPATKPTEAKPRTLSTTKPPPQAATKAPTRPTSTVSPVKKVTATKTEATKPDTTPAAPKPAPGTARPLPRVALMAKPKPAENGVVNGPAVQKKPISAGTRTSSIGAKPAPKLAAKSGIKSPTKPRQPTTPPGSPPKSAVAPPAAE